MKIFFVQAACSMLIFAGCERHPVTQLQEINERSELNPEKKEKKFEGGLGEAQSGAATNASPSPRGYFPADTK